MDIGADGMKTGFTEESGYAIVGSVSRDGKRLFAAMSGMASDKRARRGGAQAAGMGHARLREAPSFSPTARCVGEAQVYGGETSGVALKAEGPVAIFVPITNRDRLIARIVYEGPLVAPVEAGTRRSAACGSGSATRSARRRRSTRPKTSPVGTLHQRALDAVGELLIGWLR